MAEFKDRIHYHYLHFLQKIGNILEKNMVKFVNPNLESIFLFEYM
jgi:hypothetical protein